MGEYVERVDSSDEVVNVVERGMAVERKWLFRMAMVICRDEKGRFLIHRRPANAARFPGEYSWMVAGAVHVGETYECAARRELQEEMGVESDVRRLFKFLCDGSLSPYWFAVHEAVIDPADVFPSADEVAWHGWLTPQELRRDVESRNYVADSQDAFRRYLAWSGG